MLARSNLNRAPDRRVRLIKGRRGAALIEAALTTMLFLVLVFSLFDFGFVLFFHHTLTHQARVAARYGILLDASTLQNQYRIRNYFLFNDPENSTGATKGILGLDASNVAIAFQPKTASQPMARLFVTIHDYQYGLITPGVAGTYLGRDIVASLPMEYMP